jgi:RHH-type rel operon transcriptional repressor/antitoxin RelB
MLAIRLPQSIEKRLEKLARRTGRTKTYYVREAILEHLEDIEACIWPKARRNGSAAMRSKLSP